MGSGLFLAAASNAAELVSPTPAAAPATTTATPSPAGDPADAPRVAGASQVLASGRLILLEAGKGTLIRLPRPDTAGDEHRPRRLDEHNPAQQPARGAFIALFPEPIDLIVRALRSGLPISSSKHEEW